ncbi:MAG: hypothetical protein Fur0010_04150 [Bdellovibrio sp.]
MSYLLSLILTFSCLHAEEANPFLVKKIEKGEQSELHFDLDKNKVVDYIEVFKNKVLVQKREDKDGDGNFEFIINYYPKVKSGEIEERRETFDPILKILKRLELFRRDEKAKQIEIEISIDENLDGKFDRTFTNRQPLSEYREGNCSNPLSGLPQVSGFTNLGLNVAQEVDGFLTTNRNIIDKKCFDSRGRDWFLQRVENANSKGLSCLKNLGERGGRGAARNFAGLENLFNSSKVQIVCSENAYDWGTSTLAHATITAQDNKNGLRHPALSINPNFDRKFSAEDGDLEFEKTIFHEQLHNLGIRHGHDVEYPYTCETCCFPNGQTAEAVDAACKVCSGNYESAKDIKYIEDISNYGEKTFDRSNARAATVNYLKEKPGDPKGLAYLALNTSGLFNPAGIELAKKLEQDNPSPEVKAILDRARSHEGSSFHRQYDRTAQALAQAYYDMFKTGDPNKSLDALKNNMASIKQQLRRRPANEDERFVRDALRLEMRKLIYIVWIEHYTGTQRMTASQAQQLNNRAYALFNEFSGEFEAL